MNLSFIIPQLFFTISWMSFFPLSVKLYDSAQKVDNVFIMGFQIAKLMNCQLNSWL